MNIHTHLYVPTDVDEANEAWLANCGPCAVAALLGRQVAAVRELFDPWPGYTNPTLIKRALARAGCHATVSSGQSVRTGLGFVQFEGPWEKGGARAAYSHTHWVALARRNFEGEPADTPSTLFVYDTAVGDIGGWVPLEFFSSMIMPRYLARQAKATGWRFRQVLEVIHG